MSTGSIVMRRSLGRRLEALRLDADKKPADVAAAGIASRAKLHRIERKTDPVKMADVRALCWLYGADTNTTDQLAELALQTSGEGWWGDFNDVVPQWFSQYVELESAATRLLTWDPELIHGLLQTPEYHLAIFQADPDFSTDPPERQVRLRQERQRAAFDRQPPLELTVIVGEGAIARHVGGLQTIRQQRAHLVTLSDQRNVDVRVLPWEAGAHAAMKSGFTILEFGDDESPDVIYVETQAGGRYIERETMVAAYHQRFEGLITKSVPIKEHQR